MQRHPGGALCWPLQLLLQQLVLLLLPPLANPQPQLPSIWAPGASPCAMLLLLLGQAKAGVEQCCAGASSTGWGSGALSQGPGQLPQP